jgi:asparagine synthase (glutamine-hydrolysing)
MATTLRHRGPDDVGMHLDGRVGLTQTRLSIIDLSGGHQPLFSADRNLALIANGEIYNYIELGAALRERGCHFSSGSDSETILHAYASFGEEFLSQLHGMFAFALYDRSRATLLLVRDRLGIKPLYYTLTPDGIAFASEIKALLAILPRAPEINPTALHQFLENQFNTGEETIFQGIMRLPPGEALAIDADCTLRRWRYWSPLSVPRRECSFEEAAAEFDGLIETVMREHMRADVPYGLFLSGGLDSAVVLAMLNRFQDKPVRSFSVGYSAVDMRDELLDAERIAGIFNTRHTSLSLDRDRVFKRLVHTVWAADDLMRDYASLPTSILAERAGSELKVVLTGEGGDEVFAGYRRYRKTALQRAMAKLLGLGSAAFRTRSQLHWSWRRRLYKERLAGIGVSRRAPFIAAWQSTPADWTDLQRAQYTDLTTALPDNLLVKLDRMLMAFGVEGRVPFLDHRVVEFGLSLPDDLKVSGDQGKLFLRRWAEQYLPKEHIYRRKKGFHVPIGEWLRGDFLDRLAVKLAANVAVREWFDPDGVRALMLRQRTHHDVSREVWCLMQFAIWHHLFVERPGVRPEPEEDPLAWIS